MSKSECGSSMVEPLHSKYKALDLAISAKKLGVYVMVFILGSHENILEFDNGNCYTTL